MLKITRGLVLRFFEKLSPEDLLFPVQHDPVFVNVIWMGDQDPPRGRDSDIWISLVQDLRQLYHTWLTFRYKEVGIALKPPGENIPILQCAGNLEYNPGGRSEWVIISGLQQFPSNKDTSSATQFRPY